MIELELTTLLLLLAVAFAAGTIDAIAGGGGLLTVPALLACGLSPAQALATNKLQACFGSASATWFFWRRGLLALKPMLLTLVCTFFGSALGTLLVQQVDSQLMDWLLPFLLIAMSIYFILSPRMRDDDSERRLSERAFAFSIGAGCGFYDGFFGPGVGSFYALGFISLAGMGLRKATAHTKLLNFTSNLASLLFFTLGGQVLWTLGLIMAVGQFAGGRVGAKLVFARGAGLVKPLLVVLSLSLSAKLLWDLLSV
ncbi:TSUP family transporter [Simiduia curdlanivorans]|uniref:Probable membrane transporter protein n=1 Tax=Simiduia curdlanivorans TaxID=1492769 RepID=A0ABV8V1R9_9GAMM|nr:TSUP family transporter [Simiduia curdlanivorans]MDN3640053.1 TSUP family transporter [Simiduia curdlanivorans]